MPWPQQVIRSAPSQILHLQRFNLVSTQIPAFPLDSHHSLQLHRLLRRLHPHCFQQIRFQHRLLIPPVHRSALVLSHHNHNNHHNNSNHRHGVHRIRQTHLARLQPQCLRPQRSLVSRKRKRSGLHSVLCGRQKQHSSTIR